MKKLISFLLLICIVSNIAFADCDFSKGITKLPDGNYEYSKECHIAVGNLVQEVKTKDAQLADLTKAIQLKDLAIKASDDRATLWMNTSDKLTDRVNKIDETYRHNEFLYFGLGVLTTFAAGYLVSRSLHN